MAEPVGASSVTGQTSAAIFIVLRKMRVPLIIIIVIFGITVLGMAIIPGDSPEGPWQMGLFNAFYFMSYTATTIGFGEIPRPFNAAQRLWVTFSIYLTVIGWAYAFGTLLALLQQSAFKQALAVQRFGRRVRRINEDFWIIAGHGQAGEAVGVSLDALGRRFVAIDIAEDRVDVVDLGSYTADVPALVADARDPEILKLAGILSPSCAGILAFTNDDETNLAILMAAEVLRSEIPVIARSASHAVSQRMHSFGQPIVINPFDVFGDHLRIELRAPAAERLTHWLAKPPGTPLPAQHERLQSGSWIVCGVGHFGSELTDDLRASGVDVTVLAVNEPSTDPTVLHGDATDAEFLRQVGAAQSVGFVAGTDNDITNLSLIAAARRVSPSIVVIARQNEPRNAPLFEAMRCELLMVPGQIAAEEALAYIGTPRLRMFVDAVNASDEAVASTILDRVVSTVGEDSPELWTLTVDEVHSPALLRVMSTTDVSVSDLCRDPVDRHAWLAALPLMVVRDEQPTLAPNEDFVLARNDVVLFAGDSPSQRAIEGTVNVDESASYVLTGEHVGASWLWRTLSR